MPQEELFINGKDAYTTWGISMDDTALSALMTPAPNKEFIENKSRMEHGKRVITADPFARYDSFCNELDKGILEIKTKYQPNIVYRTIYISCNQFSQFMQGIGKFVLKLNEPNPNNRNSP